jgi:ankyrin repeat protein
MSTLPVNHIELFTLNTEYLIDCIKDNKNNIVIILINYISSIPFSIKIQKAVNYAFMLLFLKQNNPPILLKIFELHHLYPIDINKLFKNSMPNPLIEAILKNNIDIVILMLDYIKKYEPTLTIKKTVEYAFIVAVSENKEEIVIKIFELAHIYIMPINEWAYSSHFSEGSTVLRAAAKIGNISLCNLLLANNADPDVVDEISLRDQMRSLSAVWIALLHNHINICHLLIDVGANINICDLQGNTLLMIALRKTLTEFCKYLLSHDLIDLTITNIDGDTALHYACRCKNLEIAKLIAEKMQPETITHLNYQQFNAIEVWGLSIDHFTEEDNENKETLRAYIESMMSDFK